MKKILNKRIICLMLIISIFLSGCSNKSNNINNTNEPSISPTLAPTPVATESEIPIQTPEPEAAKYEFNPHLYVPILAEDIPQDYWDSFYNLCDALRVGETTFKCSSEDAYKWATSPVTLTELFPAACTKIKGESNDGSIPFENGIGKIYYQMPIDEYVERQAQFEKMVVDVLNEHLDIDDNDFEKCLKLYDYMSVNYSYDYDFVEIMPDGANYLTMMTHKGQCIELSSVYAYFLLQAGVEAMQVGCTNPLAHAWTYVVIDGKGYHSDPTWGLRESYDYDGVGLHYFMMTGERRADANCFVDDLTAPLLPKYWANASSVEFVADDDRYYFPDGAYLVSLDEDNKIIHYYFYDEEHELSYAQTEEQ